MGLLVVVDKRVFFEQSFDTTTLLIGWKLKRDIKRLEEAVQRALAETGMTEEEFADLFDLSKLFPYDDGGSCWERKTVLSITLYLLRHGQTECSRDNAFCGSIDSELTPSGVEMAQAFAAAYRSTPWTAPVIHSTWENASGVCSNGEARSPLTPKSGTWI